MHKLEAVLTHRPLQGLFLVELHSFVRDSYLSPARDVRVFSLALPVRQCSAHAWVREVISSGTAYSLNTITEW